MPMLCAVAAGVWFAGCGGRSSIAPSESGEEQRFGSLQTRIVGTARPPVAISGPAATVYGLAGATFDRITEVDTAPPTLDDTQFLFSPNEGDTYSSILLQLDPHGSVEKSILGLGGHTAGMSMSTDGRLLSIARFAFASPDQYGIFTANRDGTNVQHLPNTAGGDVRPTWSPDAKRIAFQRGTIDYYSLIFSVKVDGTGLQQLTPDGQFQSFPAWSPDGRNIAFVGGDGYLGLMNADGTNAHPIATTPDDANASRPAWSPDGSKIAFTVGSGVASEIRVVNADGSGGRYLTRNRVADMQPVWSPDGTRIAFMGDPIGYNYPGRATSLCTMKADGSDRQVLNFPGYGNGDLCWAPFPAPTFRTLVGSSGILSSAAAGIVFGQRGRSVTGVVTFDTPAANRSEARVTVLSKPVTSNIVLSVTGSSVNLTSLRFLNSDGKTNVVVGSNGPVASAAGAIVTFDASDGQVAAVVPYAATRSASGIPTPTCVAGTLVFRGDFLGGWTAMGGNVAPQGGKVVRIDAGTGHLRGVE